MHLQRLLLAGGFGGGLLLVLFGWRYLAKVRRGRCGEVFGLGKPALVFVILVMADVHDKASRGFNMSRIKGKDTKPEMLVRR